MNDGHTVGPLCKHSQVKFDFAGRCSLANRLASIIDDDDILRPKVSQTATCWRAKQLPRRKSNADIAFGPAHEFPLPKATPNIANLGS